MNLLLQQLEETESAAAAQTDNAYMPQRDRSMCSCMKDFAAPLTLLEIDTTERYDTCGAQNLQDYVFNAEDEYMPYNNNYKRNLQDQAWDPHPPQHQFDKSMQGQNAVYRNRQDAIAKQIADYFTKITEDHPPVTIVKMDEFNNLTVRNETLTETKDKMKEIYITNKTLPSTERIFPQASAPSLCWQHIGEARATEGGPTVGEHSAEAVSARL